MKTINIPYGIKMIKADLLWNQGYEGNNITIAILDTGCDYSHVDLQNNIIGGYNFTNEGENSSSYIDNNGHGTHIAGIISANGQNKVIGVAPKAKLLILKVLDKYGKGNYENIVKAINYCINWRGKNNQRVRIISMSLGLNSNIPEVHQIIKQAIKNNIIIISSSKNIGFFEDFKNTPIQYPAKYNEVISVGAINANKQIAYFSQPKVDIIAPGVNIYSTYLNNNYAFLSGNSMSVPFVAGSIALLINKYETKFNKELSFLDIINIFFKHTILYNNYTCRIIDLSINN